MSPLNKKAGFTLLEVMVAVAILGIAMVTLIGSQSQSVSMADLSRFNATAALLGRQKITEIALVDFDTLSSDEGDFGEEYVGYGWRLEVDSLGEESTNIPESEELLAVVDLTIFRGDDERFRYYLRQVIMRRLEPVNEGS